MSDHDTKSGPDRTPSIDPSTDRVRLAPGMQALAMVDADAEPLVGLPPPAYENMLIISTRHAPSRVESFLERTAYGQVETGRDEIGVVPVTATTTDYDGPLPTSRSVRPTDLTGLGIQVTEAAEHFEGGWVLLDALTLLLMYAEVSRIHRFTSTLMANLAARNIRGVYCLCPDAVEDATVQQFRSLFDAEIELDV